MAGWIESKKSKKIPTSKNFLKLINFFFKSSKKNSKKILKISEISKKIKNNFF
jgi:hypothetical protein